MKLLVWCHQCSRWIHPDAQGECKICHYTLIKEASEDWWDAYDKRHEELKPRS